jgi:hypothetical protein
MRKDSQKWSEVMENGRRGLENATLDSTTREKARKRDEVFKNE